MSARRSSRETGILRSEGLLPRGVLRRGGGCPAGGAGTSPGAYAEGRTAEDLTCAGVEFLADVCVREAALTDARVRESRPDRLNHEDAP